MLSVKKIVVMALLFILVGFAGVLFTYESFAEAEIIHEEKRFSESITDIIVETDNSKIEILPTADQEIKVEFTGDSSKKYQHHFGATVENGTLHVKVKGKVLQFFNFDLKMNSMVTKIYLPEKEYLSIQAKTENGQVKLDQLSVNTINAESTNGGIVLGNMKTEAAKLQSVNGKINISNLQGELEAGVTNGSIHLQTPSLDQPIDLETINGKITVQVVEEPANAELTAEVDNGHVQLFGEKTNHMVFGDAENQIKLKTVNGSITVTK